VSFSSLPTVLTLAHATFLPHGKEKRSRTGCSFFDEIGTIGKIPLLFRCLNPLFQLIMFPIGIESSIFLLKILQPKGPQRQVRELQIPQHQRKISLQLHAKHKCGNKICIFKGEIRYCMYYAAILLPLPFSFPLRIMQN
jgi:hypothetical protein